MGLFLAYLLRLLPTFSISMVQIDILLSRVFLLGMLFLSHFEGYSPAVPHTFRNPYQVWSRNNQKALLVHMLRIRLLVPC